jgi:two-component system alkaline phosphatase synthesis response regulator PhoP
MPTHILVVEDEAHLADGIRDNLQLEGHEVSVARDGEQALDLFAQGGVDLIVLDVMLPKQDGYSVCRAIRQSGNMVPILFLTAKNAPDDRVAGLEAGGDDYLGKPFHLKELLLRVAGMLRRHARAKQGRVSGELFTLAGHQVDFGAYQITSPEGHIEDVAQKEMAILKLLVDRMNQTISRDTILDQVWGLDVYPSSRTVDNFIVRLRKRFEPDPNLPRYFHTVRGVGYRFTPRG